MNPYTIYYLTVGDLGGRWETDARDEDEARAKFLRWWAGAKGMKYDVRITYVELDLPF